MLEVIWMLFPAKKSRPQETPGGLAVPKVSFMPTSIASKAQDNESSAGPHPYKKAALFGSDFIVRF
jgi:hypothetical protein